MQASQPQQQATAYIVNPECAVLAPNWLVFFGCLLGFGVRTGHSLHLRLLPPMWRLLTGHNQTEGGLRISDLIELDSANTPASDSSCSDGGGHFNLSV